eukprot:CAMPEP_0181398100 /NCGR_PEP_ID=MMETSP1110-20121109/852_1 /TAXON_ID=174948 /ORGANISM="Symbiodinium sp., Strain CCMP421" /LENGTH=33 /DNA_ID= /DNA_START= /DNA_END= /DNA_ORIENTATION=
MHEVENRKRRSKVCDPIYGQRRSKSAQASQGQT